jgi:non-ribosomal peptide synthetase component E (peptide arylation enzyme)
MVPGQIAFVPSLPRTGVGKLDKSALRRRFGGEAGAHLQPVPSIPSTS